MSLTTIMNKNLWYKAIHKRHSRRKYKDTKIEDEILDNLLGITDKLNESVLEARAVVVKGYDDKVFKGIIGSYGKIKGGAPSYVAFIGDKRDENYQEKVGYLGESVILAATSLGLNTCWVGGFFNSDMVKNDIDIKEYEEILAISPLGYSMKKYSITERVMSALASSKNRKELDKLCRGGFDKSWPRWIKTALECGRLAPSAVNRQPWRFKIEKKSITVLADGTSRFSSIVSERLDCGIAMLHIEIGAFYEGVQGYWIYLDDPEVAKFRRLIK